MADELDNLLRRAMKTLDGEVPSGYFEGLPQRTLARLEDDQGMQTTTSDRDRDLSTGVPTNPPSVGPDDDSGLHDIRSLAETQKRRLSARVSTSPPVDDDVLASTSASWRTIALPEPARMVSLPELADLPSKKDIKAKEKAARKSEAAIVAPIAALADAAATAPAVTPIGAHRPAPAPAAAKRTRMIALAGIGLAAAAGVTIFIALQGNDHQTVVQSAQVAPSETAKPSGAAAQGSAPAAIAAPVTVPIPAAVAADPQPAPVVEPVVPPPPPAPASAPRGELVSKHAPSKITTGKAAGGESKQDVKPAAAPAPKSGKAKDANGDPSFDDLLKEAGVNETKKPAAPVLARKSLSGGDIKQGMSSVAAKAQACFAGTQGTASVKLTVSPSGHVDKVTVGGPFAGTAVGNCVAAAVHGASFPPWDGAPQSINYSYLLSE
jgi:hypothetical protein